MLAGTPPVVAPVTRCCLDLGINGAALIAEATDPPDGTNGVAFALPTLAP